MSDRRIDLRTDALTRPTDEMWAAMHRAEFGWSHDEGRQVYDLEHLAADLLGKEAGLLVSTCSMANLLALMSMSERGTQAIFEETSHMVCLEEWGMAHICGLFPRLIKGNRGVLSSESVEDAIQAAALLNLPRTTVVCVENSHNNAGGTLWTPDQTARVVQAAHRHGARVHIDGARLFNSAIAQSVAASALVNEADSVSISLNKGLCAPWGAVLCGSTETIEHAIANRKRIGGASVHKEGIFAAAGLIALSTMIDRLAEDNRRAFELALGLARLPGLHIDLETVQSNIVLIDTSASGLLASMFVTRLSSHGVMARERSGDYQVRLVTHSMISDDDVAYVIEAARRCLSPSYLDTTSPGQSLVTDAG